jgi:iron-sulfur cluster assembly accessory protein
VNVAIGDFPMEITDVAVEKAKEALDGDKSYLRIALQGGGCSGFQYKLSFDEESDDGDYVTEVDGLTIVIDGHSAKILAGATLDHSSNLMASGFKFINPGAKRTCGCGSSFSN